ncbi:YcjX family protein [Thiomicrorhabdus aquaedulcis]|uniref:YcjX family protein n=1 Tax=Thiomicrorhabdus aquaedulcis TaxID=2211106 RepID=UPI000FD979F1|nr:YcjX family protein [Thiomicrorhabdus aquaedulcis]
MTSIFSRASHALESLVHKGSEQLEQWVSQEVHKIAITGLSRSGKSMLFTSLMGALQYRADHLYDSLPLLKSLPVELIDKMELLPIMGHTPFPLTTHLDALDAQQWPRATDEVYGFQLVIWLKQTHFIKKQLMPHKKVVFEFYDYPGEWLTDLPMLNKTFTQWSDSAWAQQMSAPQKFYANDWHAFADDFNFDSTPDNATVARWVNEYRGYLQTAKAGGISLLQPGSLLLPSTQFDWGTYGFAPLPTNISSDPQHPWTRLFSAHYNLFNQAWLKPLKETTFKTTDKQIILIDLFEGLNHSKQHVLQLKEAISNLAATFVYGSNHWLRQKVLRKTRVAKVAFVATKIDLIPLSQQANLMALLHEVTAGARAQFKADEVDFEHFLVSAMQTTDPGKTPESLRYTNQYDDYIEAQFEPLPSGLKQMLEHENYPYLPVKVPKDYLARMLNAQGLDRLFEYIIKDKS